MAFRRELRRYGGKVTLWPGDETGRMDPAALLATIAPGTAVYCCGPASLIDDVARHCDALGLPAGTLHVERFTARGGASGNTGDAFEVELASSGQVIAVDDGQPVLSALRAAGVEVLSSCEEGAAGTLRDRRPVRGSRHRDAVVTAERAASTS